MDWGLTGEIVAFHIFGEASYFLQNIQMMFSNERSK